MKLFEGMQVEKSIIKNFKKSIKTLISSPELLSSERLNI
jgi:hypothetical protein